MPSLNVTVEGLDKLLAKARPDVILYPAIRQFFNQAALTVRQEVFTRTPRRTGNLQAHLSHQVDSAPMPTWAAIGFLPLDVHTSQGDVPLAGLMEFGTGIYSEWPGAIRAPIVPTEKQALRFEIGGEVFFARSVRGTPAKRMLRDGWSAALPRVQSLLAAAAKQVEQLWGR